MPAGDVSDLFDRYGRGRGPTEISRDSGGLIKVQSAYTYMAGTARFSKLPSEKIVKGLTKAFGLPDETEVWRAFHISCGLPWAGSEAPPRPELPLIIANMPLGVEDLDHHPKLVDAFHQMIAVVVDTLRQQPKRRRD